MKIVNLFQKTITKLNVKIISRLILKSFDEDSEVLGSSPTHIIQEHPMEWSEAEAPKTRKTNDCVEWLIAHQFCNYYLNNKKSNSSKKNNSKTGFYYYIRIAIRAEGNSSNIFATFFL